ncbi:MAG: hypothetical protein LBM68_07185 [Bacteroidales bacterium]|jgi:O-antigen/teichoic acid export membrane protein|nr:hypothetical protein [Bacteroidales bacterium]
MRTPQQASTRVVFNTGILYGKMLLTMGITLYSTRLVLNALGASDYGIFNLIAGVIAMLSFLNAAMTVSTQRYLSFHQGTGDFAMQKKIFTNSWVLHIGIGVVVVALLFAMMPFLFGGFLNIPADRISTAKVLYAFMSVSVFFTIISVPFTASLNAHENMLWIAVVNIIESIIKLAIALSLAWFLQPNRLVAYGAFMAGMTIISFTLYSMFCLRKYSECSVKHIRIDKPLIKELTGFAGWNLFGALCGVGRTQGIAVVLNIFFGTVVNAAYGIANQISAQVQTLSYTMLRALNPQIMKSEGMNDRKRMLRLAMIASKFGFFLVAIVAIPIIFEMPAILKLWLKNVPEYTVMFCSFTFVAVMIMQLTIGLMPAAQSTGKIKGYQTIVGGILLLNLPIAFILLKIGLPVISVVISLVTIEFIATIVRLFYLRHLAGLSIRDFFKKVFLRETIPVLAMVATCWLITNMFYFNYRFLLTGFISVLVFLCAIYFTGLCQDEKLLVNELIGKVLKKRK